MKYILFAAALAAALPAQAQIYKCQEGGKTVYSDSPCNKEQIERIKAEAKAKEEAKQAEARAREERELAAAKDRERRAAADRAACQATMRTPPIVVNDKWDGSVIQVQMYLKHALKDPDSFEAIEWSQVARTCTGYAVKLKYRARNGFGGMNIEHQLFQLGHDGKVTDVMPL